MFMYKNVQGMIFGNVSLEAKLVGPKHIRLLCVFEPSESKILQDRQPLQQVVFAISCACQFAVPPTHTEERVGQRLGRGDQRLERREASG